MTYSWARRLSAWRRSRAIGSSAESEGWKADFRRLRVLQACFEAVSPLC